MTSASDRRCLDPKQALYIVWFSSLAAMLGSLFFSEVMKFPPCVLCWYQRIAIYPLAILLPVAIIRDEAASFRKYALLLTAAGFAIAAYHNLIYYGVVSEALSPCREGASCSSRQLEWLGFVSIPLLSLGAFALNLVVLAFSFRKEELR
jgi:disulfide bond formation protein DsbB